VKIVAEKLSFGSKPMQTCAEVDVDRVHIALNYLKVGFNMIECIKIHHRVYSLNERARKMNQRQKQTMRDVRRSYEKKSLR
jgi:hypothetical protein